MSNVIALASGTPEHWIGCVTMDGTSGTDPAGFEEMTEHIRKNRHDLTGLCFELINTPRFIRVTNVNSKDFGISTVYVINPIERKLYVVSPRITEKCPSEAYNIDEMKGGD